MIFECEKSLPVVNVYILWEAHFVEFLVCGNGHPSHGQKSCRTYTERQKKLIFFRAMPTKIYCIKMNDFWIDVS